MYYTRNLLSPQYKKLEKLSFISFPGMDYFAVRQNYNNEKKRQ
jgi:hypothetical protein